MTNGKPAADVIREYFTSPRRTTPHLNPPTVEGGAVALAWTSVSGAVQDRIEAGSQVGAASLAVFDTGSSHPAVAVQGVPDGVYVVRVRAIGADGSVGEASNEIVVTVGRACLGPPIAPTALRYTVSGSSVSLAWRSPSAATELFLVVGTASGAANLAVIPVGRNLRSLGAVAPPGTYFARFYATNVCGVSGASNEIVVTVQ